MQDQLFSIIKVNMYFFVLMNWQTLTITNSVLAWRDVGLSLISKKKSYFQGKQFLHNTAEATGNSQLYYINKSEHNKWKLITIHMLSKLQFMEIQPYIRPLMLSPVLKRLHNKHNIVTKWFIIFVRVEVYSNMWH